MKLRHLPFAFLSSRSPEGLLIAAVLAVLGTLALKLLSGNGGESMTAVRLLAELGSAEAESRIGVMMADQGNTGEAEKWLLRSVRNGSGSGIPELGKLYLGRESPAERAKGFSMLLGAAGRGSGKARYLLARNSELNGEKIPCYVWNALALDRDAVNDADAYVLSDAEKGRTRCSEKFTAEDYRKAESVLNEFLRITGNAAEYDREPDGTS